MCIYIGFSKEYTVTQQKQSEPKIVSYFRPLENTTWNHV